jgi:hypothetical protein
MTGICGGVDLRRILFRRNVEYNKYVEYNKLVET